MRTETTANQSGNAPQPGRRGHQIQGLRPCGFTSDGRPCVGGAFQLADTMGFPLWASLDQAEARNWVVSMPHYFASAIEHGWDDKQTFAKIREALADRGKLADFEAIRSACVTMFMATANAAPDQSAVEIARRMREQLESAV